MVDMSNFKRVCNYILLMIQLVASMMYDECVWPVPGEENVTTIDTAVIVTALLEGYEAQVRPSVWKEQRLDAQADKAQIKLLVLGMSVNEADQTFSIQGRLQITWKDERLIYDGPTEGCALPVAHRLPIQNETKIWRPEVIQMNLAASVSIIKSETIILSANGVVSQFYSFDSTFLCPLRAKLLPWDNQQCTVHFQSKDLPVTDLVLFSQQGDLHYTEEDKELGEESFEWNNAIEIKNARSKIWALRRTRSEIYTSDFKHSVVIFEFDLKRRSGYHVTNSMMPAIIFLLISYQSFFINRHNAPARVTLGTIPVLIMRLLLNNVYANLETVSYQAYLLQFLNICMWACCACVIEYSFVQMALFREHQAADRRAALNILSKRLRCDCADSGTNDDDTEKSTTTIPKVQSKSALHPEDNSIVYTYDHPDPNCQKVNPRTANEHTLLISNTQNSIENLVLPTNADEFEEIECKNHEINDQLPSPPQNKVSTSSIMSSDELQKVPSRRGSRNFDPKFLQQLEETAHQPYAKTSHGSRRHDHSIIIETRPKKRKSFHNSRLFHVISHHHTMINDDKNATSTDDNQTDEDEFMPAGFNPVFQRDISQLKFVFDQADADNSGAIEASEVATILRRYGVYISIETAIATILNYYYFNEIPIPKKTYLVDLDFEQFVDFITNYDNYALGHDEASTFRSNPTSLQIDIISAWIYIPFVAIILIFHFLYWFYFTR